MVFSIRPGVFPAMITPFTADSRLDFDVIGQMVDYYAGCGCTGIFAVCQSSEMFYLNGQEKCELMRCVADASAGRLQLVASGHTASDPVEQIRQLAAMAENGADVSVMVLNRLAGPDEDEDMVRRNAECILRELDDVVFGLYECPYPYKRLASPDLVRWFGQTGRFVFLKDTCCRLEKLTQKKRATEGTPLKIYNANTATLLDSLRNGIDGYSGVMANFHADLYTALLRLHSDSDGSRAEALQSFLTLAALIERQLYPVNAKYRMQLEGIPIGLNTRVKDASLWNPTFAQEVRAIHTLEEEWRKRLEL